MRLDVGWCGMRILDDRDDDGEHNMKGRTGMRGEMNDLIYLDDQRKPRVIQRQQPGRSVHCRLAAEKG